MANNNSPALPTGKATAAPAAAAAFIPISSAQQRRKLDYRKSPLLMIASVIAISNVLVMLVAFLTASWVVTYADLGAYGTKSQQVGLWQYCYDSSHRFSFRDARKKVSTDESVTPASAALAAFLALEAATRPPLTGCQWMWQFDFWYMKDFMQPPFFVAGQILFTFALVLSLAVGWTVVKLWRRRYVGREPHVAAALCISSAVSGFCTLATLIIFASNVYTGSWLNDWPVRTVSWSYGVAVAGLVLSFCVSSLFGWLAHRLQAMASVRRGSTAAYEDKLIPNQVDKDNSNVQLLRYNESDFAASDRVF